MQLRLLARTLVPMFSTFLWCAASAAEESALLPRDTCKAARANMLYMRVSEL